MDTWNNADRRQRAICLGPDHPIGFWRELGNRKNERRNVANKLEITVHEFLTIMGKLDAERKGQPPGDGDSIYDTWYDHWVALEKKVDKLSPMARADMLFDGKVGINAISENHLAEIIGVVEDQIAMHRELIKTDDEDADPEDLAMWQERLSQLVDLRKSTGWR